MYARIFAALSLSFFFVYAEAQGSSEQRLVPLTKSDQQTQSLKARQLHLKWRTRVQSLLDAGKLPKIDMETSWSEDTVRGFVPGIFPLMDELGIALIAADGRQTKQDGSTGYRWSAYILELSERYPDRFIPTTNGGTNQSWLEQKDGTDSFIEQLEQQTRAGRYALIGELDFRHYVSSHQCAARHKHRDNAIPLTSPNGHRAFSLSHETGIPFVIHLEPEDESLAELEKMLEHYPKARLVVAHFGQLRHPEKQRGFTPQKVKLMFEKFPNLHWDLSTGWPNREYRCAGSNNTSLLRGDTVLWAANFSGQSDTLQPEWRLILTEFHDRFVFATDFGTGRPPLPGFLRERVANFERIVRDLPREVQHAFAYKNAWRLLTGKPWD